MGRDFTGVAVKVKQEMPEEPTDPAPNRSLAMQWSFSNKTHSQYVSFECSDDHNKPKTGFDSLASAGLVTMIKNKAVDSIHGPYSSVTQKNTMLTYPPHQFGAHSVQQLHEGRVLPVVSHTHPISVRGASISSPISVVPTRDGVVGTTELTGAPKISTVPAQLTVFYAGSVCVYNDVSPEKAQAIMLLAGNAPPVTPNTTSIASPVQTIPKSPFVDAFVVNGQCHGTTPCISSPVPITSYCASQLIGVSDNTNEVSIIKSIGVLESPCSTAQPSKVISFQESRPPSHTLSAVPQARKASLARFFEKRKERIMSASPYPNSKQTPQHSSNPGLVAGTSL